MISLFVDSSGLLVLSIAWTIISYIYLYTRERIREKEALAQSWNIPQCKIDAPKGSTEAQYLLGRAYLESIGVQHDEAEGLYWLEQAAAQGHKEAYKYLHNRQSELPTSHAKSIKAISTQKFPS